MSNEEIVKEIDEAMESLRETKRKIGGAFSKARNIVIKDSTVDTEAYNKGLNDAWELANKISDIYSASERAKIFSYVVGGITVVDILRDFSPQEALAKLEAYEKEQNEIKVGDVVTIFPRSGGEYNAVVVRETNDMHIDVIYSDGITACNVPPELYKKTGKHIDIQSLLEQIKE